MHGGLANLAVILVFTIIFFSLLTQRMMMMSDQDSFLIAAPIRHENSSVLTTIQPQPHISQPISLMESTEHKRTQQSVTTVANKVHHNINISLESIMIAPKIVQQAIPVAKDTKVDDRIHFLDSPSTVVASTVAENSASKEAPKSNLEFHELQTVVNHPYESPRAGTDIGPQQHARLLLCPNQSKCIVPELQLQKKYKIYLCKKPVPQGVRFYFLAREGLLLHPNVELLGEADMMQADYFIYLPGSAPWQKSECNDTTLAPRMIVLDEFDGHTLVSPTLNSTQFVQAYGKVNAQWYFMYFKRSFVRRDDGKFLGYPHLSKPDAYPMTYAVAEAYLPHKFNVQREIEISCTLRGSKHMTTRLRVQQWVAEYGELRAVRNVISKQVNHEDRIKISTQYFEMMYNAQIIVTVNPAHWEGDFRLWEAMGSGALIFVDPVFVPHQFPLLDGEHVVYFSNTNKTDLFAKLDYYRTHPVEARRVAVSGYLHAMKYHRTVNLMDYVLRSTHLKEATLSRSTSAPQPIPQYSYTGQYLNAEARLQEDAIRDCHAPGIYEDPLLFGGLQLNGTQQTRSPRRRECIKKRKAPTSNIQFLDRR